MKYARILSPARTKRFRLKAGSGPTCYERLPKDRQSVRRTNPPVHTVFPVGMVKRNSDGLLGLGWWLGINLDRRCVVRLSRIHPDDSEIAIRIERLNRSLLVSSTASSGARYVNGLPSYTEVITGSRRISLLDSLLGYLSTVRTFAKNCCNSLVQTQAAIRRSSRKIR